MPGNTSKATLRLVLPLEDFQWLEQQAYASGLDDVPSEIRRMIRQARLRPQPLLPLPGTAEAMVANLTAPTGTVEAVMGSLPEAHLDPGYDSAPVEPEPAPAPPEAVYEPPEPQGSPPPEYAIADDYFSEELAQAAHEAVVAIVSPPSVEQPVPPAEQDRPPLTREELVQRALREVEPMIPRRDMVPHQPPAHADGSSPARAVEVPQMGGMRPAPPVPDRKLTVIPRDPYRPMGR